MNINRIINESINKVITEGYAGRDYEGVVNTYMSSISDWLNYGKQKYVVRPYRFKIDVSLNKYNLIGSDGTPLRGYFPVYITLNYRPDYNITGKGVAGETDVRDLKVTIIATRNATAEFIKTVILHELTHVIDIIIESATGYKTNGHQPNTNMWLPNCINMILYCLWDTSEFNAWQSYPDLTEFVERMMGKLEEANKIEDKETWEALGGYLLLNRLPRKISIRNMRNAARIKKYFMLLA
jgi:hypothetical protein